MARSRNIKPGFFMNDELAEIQPLGRILFAGLWCVADRKGRLEDRPKRIKAEVLPYDDCDVDNLLDQLAERDFITRYQVDGERYIQVTNFVKHQNPHKNEKDSTIPPPNLESHAPDNSDISTVQTPEHSRATNIKQPEQNSEESSTNVDMAVFSDGSGTSTVQALEKHSTNRADSFNMIPDSLNMIEECPDKPETSSSPQERECLKQLKAVPNYPFVYQKDLEHLRNLAVDFPKLDMVSEIKKWCSYKLDHPLKRKSNPRLQLRRWFENAQKWSKDERASPVGQTGQPDKFEGIYLT